MPTITPPITGTKITNQPKWWSTGDAGSRDTRFKKKRLVIKSMSITKPRAMNPAQRAIKEATEHI
jgi:hypothetical protein